MVIGAKRNPARPIPAAAMVLLHKVKINARFNFFYFQLQTVPCHRLKTLTTSSKKG